MRVLLTRAETDAQDMTAACHALGIETASAALMEPTYKPIARGDFSDAAAIVATSRNGLKALAHAGVIDDAITFPLFSVGPGTTSLARELGFQTIFEGEGTALDLVETISGQQGILANGSLLQLTGDVLAVDLTGPLAAQGIQLRQIPAYAMIEATQLPPGVYRELVSDQFDAVVLMSPRTAGIWARLIKNAALERNLDNLTHVCISPAVAARLETLVKPKIAVAKAPNRQEILNLIHWLAARAPKE